MGPEARRRDEGADEIGGALPLLDLLEADAAVGAMKEDVEEEIVGLAKDGTDSLSVSLEAWKEVDELNPPEVLDFLLTGPAALVLSPLP